MAGTDLCARCTHPRDWHRLDDALNVGPTDSAAEFRCIGYDCTGDGTGYVEMASCPVACPDFVEAR